MKTILVVEDDLDVHNLIMEILSVSKKTVFFI